MLRREWMKADRKRSADSRQKGEQMLTGGSSPLSLLDPIARPVSRSRTLISLGGSWAGVQGAVGAA